MALISSDVRGKSMGSSAVLFKQPFMRPAPVKRKSAKKEVLDEETYTQDLENIIERDFFPDLSKMKAHLDYKEALENNDVVKLRELRDKYGSRLDSSTRAMELGGVEKSPATFETPVAGGSITPYVVGAPVAADVSKPSSSDDDNIKRVGNRGLDLYLALNTSEDNASFGVIMDEANRKHRQKYAWLYDKELEHAKYREKTLSLPSTEDEASDNHRIAALDMWTYTNKNYVMYVPDGAELTAAEKQAMAVNRSKVMHSNTRFCRLPFNEQANREAICAAAHLQARAKEGKIGVDGKELAPSDEPQVNGYGFVVTPSPAPGVNESPMMTWGEIDGTPFRLDGNQTPSSASAIVAGPSFHIAAVPNRDRLAKKLAEKVCKQHREKKRIALQAVKATLSSPSPLSSHVERLASMSPAVQRLASSHLRINLGDKSLRLSYTPSKTPRSSCGDYSTTPIISTSTTPVVETGSKRTTASVTNQSSLTDDLLNLPKRSRARDFFSPN